MLAKYPATAWSHAGFTNVPSKDIVSFAEQFLNPLAYLPSFAKFASFYQHGGIHKHFVNTE
ncbi:MAG: hypothetical protein DRP91_01320 [Candidatus Neomarinimicrobiota bacterium]|nr:MAG: hypothetical protein DRP91_01320 [Candidatus Neomarinimicrobiota bacterium]